jgi:hypothetical protein
MPIQQVKGQPYTTYVISGTTSPANYAQQFAQLATQQKYEQLRMAEQAAQLEYQAEQQQRAMGIKSYQEELDAARKDQIRNEQQLEAVRKEIRATQGKMAELGIKAQPSTSVSTSVGGGSTRTPKSRTEQIDAELLRFNKALIDARAMQDNAITLKQTLGSSDPVVSEQAQTAIDTAENAVNDYNAKITSLRNEKLAIESDPSLDVIDSGGGSGGTRTTTRVTPGKDTSQARGDYQSILDDLLTREQELQAYTPQQISQPTLPPQEEYLNKVRRIAQEQLGVKPSRMQRIPAPQGMQAPQGMPTQNEAMRNYLLSLLPPSPPTQTEQPIAPLSTPSSGIGIQQDKTGGQGAVTPLGSLDATNIDTMQTDLRNLLRKQMSAEPPLDVGILMQDALRKQTEPQFTLPTELGKQTTIPLGPTIEELTNLEQDIEDPSIRPQTIVTPQRQLELDMIGAQPTPSQQVIPAPQQQTLDTMQSPTTSKPDMLSERKMKRVVRDIERLNKARTYPSDDIEKLLNSRNPPEHIKLAISLYNPSRYDIQTDKIDSMFKNAVTELERFYANDPQKANEAIEFLIALYFMRGY